MAPLGRLSQRVRALLTRNLDRQGLVVWYDPQRAYGELLDRLDLDAPVVRYDDGLFRLRERLEPVMEWVQEDGSLRPEALRPPRLLVYLPMERSGSEYALVEAETSGAVVEPGAADPECDSRLGRLVELLFGELQPARAAHLSRQADEGLLRVEELDRMAEEAGTPHGALALVFGYSSSVEILLAFLADPSLDQAIEAKQALSELADLVRTDTGLEPPHAASPSGLRAALERHLLLAEPALALPAEELPPALRELALPASTAQRDTLDVLCRQWRDRLSLRQAYAAAADRVEAQVGAAALTFSPRSLAPLETFYSFERRLLLFALEQLQAGAPREAVALAAERSGGFWSRERPEARLRWALVEAAAELLERTQAVQEALKARRWSLPELIDAYTRAGEPWLAVDRLERTMEIRYARCSVTPGFEEGPLEAVMTLCRGRYAETLDALARAFSAAGVAAGFRADNALAHTEVYRTAVAPALAAGRRVAYLLVDALRYEMAGAVAEGLEEEYEVRVEPVLAQLPSVTLVGMAALLPGAEAGLELREEGAGVGVVLGGRLLRDRAARLTWLAEKSGFPTAALKLPEALRLSPRRRRELEQVRLLVVTSQELDRYGEEGEQDEEVRRYMDEVLDRLRRAIRCLASAGFEEIVLAADHGFYFAESLDPGLVMDPPGGQTLELKARAWIGRGGGAGEGYLRLKASELALRGELEFAFPAGLGAFRVKGGAGRYFHGGASLQEALLPLCRLRRRAAVPELAVLVVELTLARPTVTSRLFSVQASLKAEGLSGEGRKRVRLEVLAGREEAGVAVLAAYGYDEGSREILLEAGKPNAITVQLTAASPPASISVRAVDCESGLVLARRADIPVSLMI